MAHLVTGFAGQPHIKSADEGALNSSFFGSGQYILESGSQFEGSIIDNNTVRISDGDGLMYGRHFRIEPNVSEDVTIKTGTAGTKRIDLICMTYEKDTNDETEKVYLEVIEGVESTDTPVVPEHTKGNILEGASFNQMVLYKVKVEGVVLSSIERIPEVIPSHREILKRFIPKFYNGLNFNDLIESGVYTGASSPQAVGATNYPINETGLLQVSGSDYVVEQTYITHNGRIFTRAKYYSFGWSEWAQAIKKSDIVDNLLSTSTDLPLSAKQGLLLSAMMTSRETVSIATSGNTNSSGGGSTVSGSCYYIPTLKAVMMNCSFTIDEFDGGTGTNFTIGTVPEGYRARRTIALTAFGNIVGTNVSVMATTASSGNIVLRVTGKLTVTTIHISGFWFVG